MRSGFNGVLHDVCQYLMHHACIGTQSADCTEVHMPGELGIERLQIGNHTLKFYFFYSHSLQLRHLAVALHKGRQAARGVIDGSYALFERCLLHHRTAHVSLRYALYRRYGIHNLVGKHTSEPLPRLHLAARHELVYLATHIVEHRLQVAFARHNTVGGQTEHEVAVAQSLTHQLYTTGETPLVAPLPKDYHCEDDDEKCYDIIRVHIA